MGRGLRDFRVAFHCHSHLSHDSKVPFDEIAAAAGKLGFNAVVLNDHYEPLNIARSPHGFWDGILFLPGVEIRPDPLPGGASDKGSLLVFGIENDFPQDRKRVDLMPELAAAGAIVTAGHCEDFQGYDRYPLEAFEVYNLHAQFKEASRIGVALSFLFLFADPFFESQVWPSRSVLATYDRLLSTGKRLAPLAGHDAHANVRLFGTWGPTLGTYPEMLRLFSNHVLAAELESGSLLEAVRRGRVYLSFDFLGDPAGFAMTYGEELEAGRPPAILGDEAPWRPESLLQVRLPRNGQIQVLRDGSRWQEARGDLFSAALPGPGVYRVEVKRPDRWGRSKLWIVTAPIYVKEGQA